MRFPPSRERRFASANQWNWCACALIILCNCKICSWLKISVICVICGSKNPIRSIRKICSCPKSFLIEFAESSGAACAAMCVHIFWTVLKGWCRTVKLRCQLPECKGTENCGQGIRKGRGTCASLPLLKFSKCFRSSLRLCRSGRKLASLWAAPCWETSCRHGDSRS